MKLKYLAFAISTLGLSAAVIAADVDDQNAVTDGTAQKVEKITVTGSNIKRVDTETTSPIQVLTKEDIVKAGATSVTELLNGLTSSTGSFNDIGGSNSFAPGASSVSLRNLGEQSTLVLLNGRRLSSYALPNYSTVFTNLDAIPLDIIDHVDILKSGASAIYGSDAVAGVINLVTRKNFQGLEADIARQQSITSGSFGTTTAGMTGGFGNLDSDHYNIVYHLDGLDRQSVMWSDVIGYTNPTAAKGIASFNALSTYSTPGNVFDVYTGAGGALPGCAPSLVVNGICMYDRVAHLQDIPGSKRANAFLQGTYDFSETLQGFAEINFDQDNTKYISAFPTYNSAGANEYWGNPSNGSVNTFISLPIVSNTANGYGNLRYRFADAPDPGQNVDTHQYRALAGLKGTNGSWDWETALGEMGSDVTATQRGAFSNSGFIQEIGNYNNYDPNTGFPTDPNFFNQPNGYKIGGPNSAAVLNTLFPTYGYTGSYSQTFLDGHGSREIFDMPGGPASIAVGFELRHENLKVTPSNNLQDGDIVGYGISEVDAARTYGSVYSELGGKITKQLEVQLAARLDKYPDFSEHISPKLALSYQVNDQLMFRAGIDSGFRAPNLTESAQSTKVSFGSFGYDPQRCQQAQALSKSLLAQATSSNPNAGYLQYVAEQDIQNECNGNVLQIVSNNPNLQPELSRGLNFGVVFEPYKGISGSLDYWRIERHNEINQYTDQQLLNQEGALPPGTTVTRNPISITNGPNGAICNDQTFVDPITGACLLTQYGVTAGSLQKIQTEFTNVGKTLVDGFDLNLKAKHNFGEIGKLSANLDLTYNRTIRYWNSALNGYGYNLAGAYNNPRINAVLDTGWEKGPYSVNLRTNFTSGTTLFGDYGDNTQWNNQGCIAQGFTQEQCRIASFTTEDLLVSYRGFKNLTLSMHILNLFNRASNVDVRALSTASVLPLTDWDARGRMMTVGANYKFF